MNIDINYKRFLFFDYFGFPYGGDSIVWEGEISYTKDRGWKVGGRVECMVHGHMDFFSSHSTAQDNNRKPDIKDPTPYKKADYRYTLSLYGEWKIDKTPYFKEMEMRCALDWTKGKEDKGDLQFTLGLTIMI